MISVCLSTYNGSKHICDQISSILVQLEPNDEIIISDDCSTDNTLQLIRDLSDSRIKIFENKN
jgi:glycosyltransferase involved in cell wall biosynthesis